MLKEFIRTHKFSQFIHEGNVVDTRPWVCEEIKNNAPREFLGINFGLVATAVLSPPKPVIRKNLGFLEVGYTIAGQTEPVPASNWEDILNSLPNGAVVCCDQYTDSRHLVGTVRFVKDKDVWVEKVIEPAAELTEPVKAAA